MKCPVLALDGSKDMQLDPKQNLDAMKAAFARSGNPDATVELLPGLNYMFQKAETGLGWEYATIHETISPEVLQIIGDLGGETKFVRESAILKVINSQLINFRKRGAKMKIPINSNQHCGIRRFACPHH
jgi:hypothetical protein